LIEVGFAGDWELMGLEIGREEGLEKGLEKGREEGLQKKQLEIAQNMLTDGLDVNLISRYTGLSLARIEVYPPSMYSRRVKALRSCAATPKRL
jgi:hypothetical protein